MPGNLDVGPWPSDITTGALSGCEIFYISDVLDADLRIPVRGEVAEHRIDDCGTRNPHVIGDTTEGEAIIGNARAGAETANPGERKSYVDQILSMCARTPVGRLPS